MADNPFARKPPLEGWRPIATAPKDGEFLAYDSYSGKQDVCEFQHGKTWPTQCDGTWGPCEGSFGYHLDGITHWMPLPAAPKLGGDNYG